MEACQIPCIISQEQLQILADSATGPLMPSQEEYTCGRLANPSGLILLNRHQCKIARGPQMLQTLFERTPPL